MIVKSEIIERVRGRRKISLFAAYMQVHSGTLHRWLKDNEEDGPLTRVKALVWMSKEFECDILDVLENDINDKNPAATKSIETKIIAK